MIEPGRSFSSTSAYRYGFNGKEQDSILGGGTGIDYNYGFRIYDARIVRFNSVDALTNKYASLTPYQYASNRPIDGVDRDGLEYLSFNSSIYRLQYAMGFAFVGQSNETNVFQTVYENIPDADKNPQTHDLKQTYGGIVGAFGKDLDVSMIQGDNPQSYRYYNPGPEFSGAADDAEATPNPSSSTIGLFNFKRKKDAVEINESNESQITSPADAVKDFTGIITNWTGQDMKKAMNTEAENRRFFYKATNDVDLNNKNNIFGGVKLGMQDRADLVNFIVDGHLPTEQLSQKGLSTQSKLNILTHALNIANLGVQALSQWGLLKQGTIDNVNGLLSQYKSLGGNVNNYSTMAKPLQSHPSE